MSPKKGTNFLWAPAYSPEPPQSSGVLHLVLRDSFLRQPIRFKETFQQPMRIKQSVGILAHIFQNRLLAAYVMVHNQILVSSHYLAHIYHPVPTGGRRVLAPPSRPAKIKTSGHSIHVVSKSCAL